MCEDDWLFEELPPLEPKKKKKKKKKKKRKVRASGDIDAAPASVENHGGCGCGGCGKWLLVAVLVLLAPILIPLAFLVVAFFAVAGLSGSRYGLRGGFGRRRWF